MQHTKTKMLVVVDFSYWEYVTIFGATCEFQRKEPLEYKYWLKPAKETDQNNLPDILASDAFRKILRKYVMKRCETIDWQLKSKFDQELDAVDQVDIVFAQDDSLGNSFRKELYPEYKGQRKLTPKQFDVFKVKNYVKDVIFKELELEAKYGYKFVKVDGAEADDVIATIFKKCSSDYQYKVLFASDRDFVQLKDVHQLDLFGEDIEPKLAGVNVSRDEYLLLKILLGDKSDNISQVFKGVGQKRALALIKERDKLKQMLAEDQDAAHQFILNKTLISFDKIPDELSQKIVEKVNQALYSDDVINATSTFGNFEWL